MTDEIKMCKQDGMCIGIVREAKCWEPLDPQPSCENCKHLEECKTHYWCIYCGNIGMPDSFFCKYWEMKK